MSQIKAEISLRTNVKLNFHKNVGLQWYQWIPDFYNIRFEQNNLKEKIRGPPVMIVIQGGDLKTDQRKNTAVQKLVIKIKNLFICHNCHAFSFLKWHDTYFFVYISGYTTDFQAPLRFAFPHYVTKIPCNILFNKKSSNFPIKFNHLNFKVYIFMC